MLTLDAAAFSRLVRSRKFQPRTLEIARRLIVDGEQARDLAHAYGLAVSRIYNIGMQVAAAYQAERIPSGWVETTLVAPAALVRDFERQISKARKELLQRKREPGVVAEGPPARQRASGHGKTSALRKAATEVRRRDGQPKPGARARSTPAGKRAL